MEVEVLWWSLCSYHISATVCMIGPPRSGRRRVPDLLPEILPKDFWIGMNSVVRVHNILLSSMRTDHEALGMNLEFFYDNVGNRVKPARDPNRITTFLHTYREIENANIHYQL
ncbi:hypothetical protein ZWY2020_038929 [Hordeum vulgare]|nr:hypothetical protein ZWY2020_038929 [Hordeum vulgare]